MSEIPLGPDLVSARDTKRPVGYIDNWKPYQKSEILLGQVKDILHEYEEHLPLTVRQIYYRLVAKYKHDKGDKFASRLGELLVSARRAGEIPFEDIRDDGIQGGGCFPTLDQLLAGQDAERYRFRTDRQVGQPLRLQVWCEAAGMIPQLVSVAREFSVPVYSCGGFNSLTAIRHIVDNVVHEGDTVVLHLGDCDPSGESIFERVQRDVPAFLKIDAPDLSFEAVRVALTEEQIREHDVVQDPIKTKDTRSLSWIKAGRTHKAELEALAPDVIARLLGQAIEDHIDAPARESVLESERWEAEALKSLPSGISYEPLIAKEVRLRQALEWRSAA